jgi:hypothetical protein
MALLEEFFVGLYWARVEFLTEVFVARCHAHFERKRDLVVREAKTGEFSDLLAGFIVALDGRTAAALGFWKILNVIHFLAPVSFMAVPDRWAGSC